MPDLPRVRSVMGIGLAALAAVASLAQQTAAPASGPVAIVPLDSKNPDAGATVTGALEVTQGRAIIVASGTVTSGSATTNVLLPRRGTLRICAHTSVKLASDSSVPAGEMPGLLMALDHGAIEASFAIGQNSDVVLTPDFRILIGGPGAAEVKVRLAAHGDTCIDNPGVNAPYVLVSSVFDGGAYRVQPGQRVMFQRGSLHEVVDNEKEPCGCPPAAAASAGANDFPLAESEGLAPLPAAPPPATQNGGKPQSAEGLVYSGDDHAPAAPGAEAAPAPVSTAQSNANAALDSPKTEEKRPGFFKRLGNFFRKIFGAE